MRLSAYFHLDEFQCHDGTDVPDNLLGNVTRLAGTLTLIRLAAGVPLAIISGYRTPDYNKRIGGAAQSTHMTCEGADVRPGRGMSPAELHDMILAHYQNKKLPDLGGLGLYRSWVHVDIKKAADGHLRRWTGKGVGSERSE